MMSYIESDAIPEDPKAFRFLLKNLDDGLGSEDCHKLSFLAADIGVSKAKLQHVCQAIDIFDELEYQMLISPNDVSLLWEMMELIHRNDLLQIIHLHCNNYRHVINNTKTSKFSIFRRLLLEIADNTSNSEMDKMKHYCKDYLGRQAVSKLKDVFQLFSLLEERGKLSPTQLELLQELLELVGNVKMVDKIQQFKSQMPRVPTDIELVQLSFQLGTEWQKLGTYLGLQYHILKAINQDYHSTQEKTVNMLFAWRNLSRREDAYGNLSKALKLCHRMDLAIVIDEKAYMYMYNKPSVTTSSADKMMVQQLQPVHVQKPFVAWLPSNQSHNPGHILKTPRDFLVSPVSSTAPVHSYTGVPETMTPGYQVNPSDQVLRELSEHIATEWQEMGTFLKLDSNTITRINKDFPYSEEKAFNMLVTWRRKLQHNADGTAILAMILETVGRPDLSKRLKGYQVNPSDQVLRELSEHIATEWQEMGTFLKLDSNTITRINKDFPYSEEKAFNMLVTWRSKLQHNADGTAILAMILKTVGRPDLSERLKGLSSPTSLIAKQLQQLHVQQTIEPMITETTPDLTLPSSPIIPQANRTNPDPTSPENLTVKSEGLRHGMHPLEEQTLSQTAVQYTETGLVNATQKPVTSVAAKPIQQESYDEYRMDRIPRGLCMIINNQVFRKLSRREGSQIDTGKLNNLFNKLHFKVQVKENLSANDMYSWFKEVSQIDHSQYDCFVCCIMSHGKLGSIYGSDDDPIEIQEILALFKAVSCKSLNDKPKLFFIQACQGDSHQEGVDIETDEPHPPLGMGSAMQKTLPKEADFLLSYATVPGYVSYRSVSQGSWYVSALVDEINKHHNELDLLRIMTRINNRLSEPVANVRKGRMKQVPAPSYTLRKEVYFREIELI